MSGKKNCIERYDSLDYGKVNKVYFSTSKGNSSTISQK